VQKRHTVGIAVAHSHHRQVLWEANGHSELMNAKIGSECGGEENKIFVHELTGNLLDNLATNALVAISGTPRGYSLDGLKVSCQN